MAKNNSKEEKISRFKASTKNYARHAKDSIIYTAPSGDAFWETIREEAEAEANLTTLSYSDDSIKELFGDIAYAEYNKEVNLLNQFLGSDEISDQDTLTDRINILLQGRERYEALLERINRIMKNAVKKRGAPNMSTFFATYLNPCLVARLDDYMSNFMKLNESQQVSEYYKAIDGAIEDASLEMIAAKDDRLTGGGEEWEAVFNAFESDPFLWELFKTNLKAKIGNDKLAQLQNAIKTSQDSGSKVDVLTFLNLKSRVKPLGGTVAENALAAVAIQLNRIRGSNNGISYNMVGGGALTVEGPATADSFLVFSADTTIDPTKEFEKLNESTNSTYMENVAQTVEDFKNNTDKLFGIFINAKNYSLNLKDDREYSKKRTGKIANLQQTFDELNIQAFNVEDFIITALNTAPQAIAHGMRTQVEESLVAALKVGAAKLMFNDYAAIGTEDNNLIHVYQLSGKFIPSSVIFNCLAKATADSYVNVEAQVRLPNDIPYNTSLEGEGRSNDEKRKNAMIKQWDDQFRKSNEQAQWTAKFIINVREAISKIR